MALEETHSPEQLYRDYLYGSAAAFEQLMELFREHLIFFLYRYVRDMHAAEDLAEDVFVELLLHRHRYHFKCSLKTYLFTIARNKAVNYVKREAKRHELNEAFVLHEDDEAAVLEEHLLKEETQRRVSAGLQKLSEDHRTVLHLLYMEELSVKDAAKVMGKTPKQVESLAYRARGALRAQMEEGEG